jgi:hypothetical protein
VFARMFFTCTVTAASVYYHLKTHNSKCKCCETHFRIRMFLFLLNCLSAAKFRVILRCGGGNTGLYVFDPQQKTLRTQPPDDFH